MAFQIGNEPDSFRNRYRPATWGPADYLTEWDEFHDAIVAKTPEAKFAGPDISNKLPFLTAFAEEAAEAQGCGPADGALLRDGAGAEVRERRWSS